MIPTRFVLANRRWKVKFVTQDSLDGSVGKCDPEKCVIYLADDIEGEYLAHTFEHELTHALWFTHGITDHDEVAVDGISALRRQYELTRR